jgi:hypothetical protein
METTNPAQGRLRGRTDADLVTSGRDRFYVTASAGHRLSVPFPESGWPIDMRVARHLAGARELIKDLGELEPEKNVAFQGIPGYSDVIHQGLGFYLR